MGREMSQRTYYVVLNPKSGTALALGLTAETLEQRLAAAGHTATVDADDSAPFMDRIAKAANSDADTIIAAGGDGTVTAIAHAIINNGKTLALLPTGTANLLARDLKIPLDVDEAIAALDTMVPRRIDVGEVNGRVFLHNVTVGLIPSIAVGRERIREEAGWAAKIAFLGYFLRRLARAKRLAVELTIDGTAPRAQRVQAVSVSNNTYDEAFGHVFSRQRLDAGTLGVYVLKHLRLRDLLSLSLGMIAGNWRRQEPIIIENAGEVILRLNRPTVMAMLDGEIESMSVPLAFRIRPRSLSVLAPPEAPDEATDDQQLAAAGV